MALSATNSVAALPKNTGQYRHRPMIEVGPEALAQAEGLDLPVTELDELRLFRCSLAPKFWQCGEMLQNAARSRACGNLAENEIVTSTPTGSPLSRGRADAIVGLPEAG